MAAGTKQPLVHLVSAHFSELFTTCFNFTALNPTALLELRHLCYNPGCTGANDSFASSCFGPLCSGPAVQQMQLNVTELHD